MKKITGRDAAWLAGALLVLWYIDHFYGQDETATASGLPTGG
jgi:hypothetical protein